MLLIGMLASLAMSIAIPHAFGDRELAFAGGYVGLQVISNAFIVACTTSQSPLHASFRRILAWSLWTGAIWIAGAEVGGLARTLAWTAALALDYAGPFLGHWTPVLGRTAATDWELEHAHFAERFQLFVIIALGESIAEIGETASAEHLTTGRWLAIALGLALAALLWWLYFDEIADRSAEDFEAVDDQRGRLGRDAYTYLHIPIVAGIIVSAVALDLVIDHPTTALGARELLTLAAGPALYLFGHLGFRLRVVGTLARKRAATILAIGVAALAASSAAVLVPLALIVLILALLAASETSGRIRQERRRLDSGRE